MSADLVAVDIHKNNAYSENVKFDLVPPRSKSPATRMYEEEAEPEKEDVEISMKAMPSKDWEMDVKSLSSSKLWLQNYGLKKNRLDMKHILKQIGFKHSDDYDAKLKRPICSRYGSSLFQRYFHPDGKTFNISVSRDKLRQIEHRLQQAIKLYKQRLEWLTTESRRVFGTIEEKSIAIVLDIRNLSPQQFDQYKAALERIIREQITSLAKFNLIHACEDLDSYSKTCVPVSSESVEGALEWVQKLNRCSPISSTATCEAVVKALGDQNLEAVYLFTEGSSSNGARELLREKLIHSRIPVHVISYNCTDADTITFLKEMTQITGARFHAYAIIMELDSYETPSLNGNASQANILLKKKTYGGVPPGAGIRDDVILLFEELEDARNNLSQIQGLMEGIPESKESARSSSKRKEGSCSKNETYMSSREWLHRHGLKSKNLDFYDILSGVAFKHTDGVVDLKQPPEDENIQTDAINKPKLVNAKYCENFPHVKWKDGSIVHVQVTPEIHRSYEQRMHLALECLQQRVDWLSQGSRELFGTVIEDQVYFLIDTSSSMQPHIQFVKDKLFVLMQEQLRHKQKFNLISFDSRAIPWRDRLVDVNEKTLHQGWTWIKELSCRGSTNSMAALRHALNDPNTQAIYLLTDGRPDQPPKSILSQVGLQQNVPVHTISFNCADREANEFLCQLAKDTGGRFHYYSEDGIDPDGPEPWESEDVRLLKREMEEGYRNLEKIAMLRDECALLSFSKEEVRCSRESRHHKGPLERPMSAPGFRSQSQSSGTRPSTAHGFNSSKPKPRSSHESRTKRPLTPQGPLVAAHTRTSLLRQLSGKGGYFDDPEWLLPETRALFMKQVERQKEIVQENEKNSKKKKAKKADSKNMSSRKWLAKHGLSAQKLTILDALSPTFIPHEPKYVPIINKHVMSKVFDDILPIAHASTNRKSVRIVNPQGVNLDLYRKEVERAREKYIRRLDRIVWEALPQNERDQFQSESAISFLDNKLALMQALDRCDWPVREHDVVLLETEIRQAEVYLQQAQDLKAAGQDRGKSLEADLEKYDDAASVASEKQYEGVGEVLEKKSQQKEKKVKMTTTKTKRALDTLRGQKVIGRNQVDGYYYPGFVIKCKDSRHALVEYDELGQQTVATRFIIPMGGAISRPPIRIGDYILARVVNQDTGLECYVPGVVQMTPRRMEDSAKFFTVIMYTGQVNHFQRSHLVKISKVRYIFLVRFIHEVSPKKEEDSVRETTVKFQMDQDKDCLSSRSESSYDSHSRSSSRSSSRSRSSERRESSRSRSPSPRSEVQNGVDKEQQLKLKRWKKDLEEKQKEQEKQQEILKKKARKLRSMHQKLEASKGKKSEEKEKLLEMIVNDMNDTKKTENRTAEWLKQQNGHLKLDIPGSELSSNAPPSLIRIRKSLPPLNTGEEVLARWSDEGWYYRGTVKYACGDDSYLLEDSIGYMEKVWREDIIGDGDDADHVFQAKDPVVALHPCYAFSYAPAVVVAVDSDLWMLVRFYDGQESRLPREEVFSVAAEKFEHNIQYIMKCEEQWIGQAVVARNDSTGIFQLGEVRERVGNGRQYSIEWSDGSKGLQFAPYIFGAFTRQHALSTGDRVLAMADPSHFLYLPGIITEGDEHTLTVKFCNGAMSNTVKVKESFWLSQDYYDACVNFFRGKKAKYSTSEDDLS